MRPISDYIMPLNFTFMFLYYTETASLSSVLMMYYLVNVSKSRSFGLLELLTGLMALLMRQTNIVWINYVVMVKVIKDKKIQSKTNTYFNPFF